MTYVLVGLGNPGDEYIATRHNVGFMVLESFIKEHRFPDPVSSGKRSALISEGMLKKEDVVCVFPQTFMNKSGAAAASFVTSAKKAERLIVVYDDIDLPLGVIKVSFGRGSGGHRGLESIIKAVKTKDFARIRVGIAPTTPGGKIRKPKGESAMQDFLLGDFKKGELPLLKKMVTKARDALGAIVTDGRVAAMNQYN